MSYLLQIVRRTLVGLLPVSVSQFVKKRVLGRPPICPQLRKWTVETGGAEIIQIHGEAAQLSRPLPQFVQKRMPRLFERNQTYPLYDRILYRIPQVKIRGKSGLLILPDGSVCHHNAWSLDHITGSPDYLTPWRGPVVHQKGNYVTLIFYWGLWYYHWFNDVLSTLHENLDLLPKDTLFILPAEAKAHHLASLDLLGIGPERRLLFDGSEMWVLENLWFQPPAVHPDDQTPGAMPWLGRTLSAGIARDETEKPLRLYISRRHVPTRVVVNEEELLPILQRHGFIVVATEKLSLAEQIRLFRNAEVIIGPHGSGLTNMIYAAPGTPVLELFSVENIRRHYWALAHECGLPYHFQTGKSVLGKLSDPDMRIDPAGVEAWIVSMLPSRGPGGAA